MHIHRDWQFIGKPKIVNIKQRLLPNYMSYPPQHILYLIDLFMSALFSGGDYPQTTENTCHQNMTYTTGNASDNNIEMLTLPSTWNRLDITVLNCCTTLGTNC